MSSVEQKKDYLKVDREVPGQKYYCISFVEPINDIFIDKEHFFLTKFFDLVQEKKESFSELYENKETGKFDMNVLKKDYSDWRTTKYEDWNKEFNEANKNRNSMRGLKIRGTYLTLEEAKERAEEVRLEDPTFHVFVAPVGYWVPFNPVNLDKMDSVYQEEMLNEIVKENLSQKKNIDKAFEDRKINMVEKAKKQVALNKLKQEETETEKDNKETTTNMINEIMENQQDNTINKEITETESEVI